MNGLRRSLLVALLLLTARRAEATDGAPSIAVVDARGAGVPTASTDAVTRQLYATVARLGYRVTPEATTTALSTQISPMDALALLGVAGRAHADHAVGATLGAESGQYVVTITLANADRTGPFFARTTTDATTLEATVDRMTRSLLPAVPLAPTAYGSPERTVPPTSRIAIQTEGAFGISSHPFYNQLIGARYDYGFTEDVALGGYVGYVNLKGKDGRASNVLPYVQLEYRIHVSNDSGFRIPLRFGSGYLAKNGPFLRFAAGLSFPLGDTAHLGFDLLAPTFWVVQNSVIVSMDVAAEVSFDL